MAKAKKIQEEEEEDEEVEDKTEEGESKKKRRKRKRKRKKADDEDDDEKEEQDATNTQEEEPDDETPRTVFIEGVPYDSTPDQVAECLQTHAKIERSEMTDLRFPTWQDSGRMRGYGHVVFSSPELVDKVLNTARTTKLWMGKRYLSIQRAKPKGLGNNHPPSTNSNPSKTIMIKNLDYTATEEDIQKVMEQFGPVVEGGTRVVRNSANRQSKGFAYVEYVDLESAKKAMERQQKTPRKPLFILKRACLLDYDEGRIKGSFKTASGKLWSKEYKQGGSNNKHARTN
jgi:nucleolin